MYRPVSILIAFLTLLVSSPARAAKDPVDFNRDIRPLLSNKCFRCHGPDVKQRKADLRLDQREVAIDDLGVISPGDPDGSELLSRLAAGPDERMPPPDSGLTLTEREIELLRRWIKEGATYAGHWAYEPVRRPPLPRVRNDGWVRSSFDRFVLARLEREKIKPSGEADRYTLARRLALDLTGLPPSIEQVDQFVADKSPQAYEKLVDELLASDRYGERWAAMWLDLARYADSAGYADDPPRTIWLYRDWVIGAFNDNLPFDQFTVEQIAGDLLPEATDWQRVATAFHRNTLTNSEGGTNDEEFRNVAIVDRVNTTMQVWMGTTIRCAQCHDHKYDPVSQEEYFRFFAFFNQSEDADRRDESPLLMVMSKSQQEEGSRLEDEIAGLKKQLSPSDEDLAARQKEWKALTGRDYQWQALVPTSAKSTNGATLTVGEDGAVMASGDRPETDTYVLDLEVPLAGITGLRLEALPDESLPAKGLGRSDGGNFVLSELRLVDHSDAKPRRMGQFVRLDLAGEGKMIHVAEIEVLQDGTNIARQGKVTQSSTDFGGLPERAIDGNTDGNYAGNSVTHTKISKDPWIEVDLGGLVAIDLVRIWNRTDTNVQSRLDGFILSILDENRELVWKETYAKAPQRELEADLTGAVPLFFADASADVEQAGDGGKTEPLAGWVARAAIDGDEKTKRAGWAVGGDWILQPLGELFAASLHGSPNVDIAVPNGPYTLHLLLYEGYRSRSADIVIEGKTVRAAYDMFKEQGGNFDHGSVLRHTFTLTDGNIDIEIKGPLHLGGLILSRGKKRDSEDRVAIVKSQADLDLKDVIKAINFGDTRGLTIGDAKFAAAAVNTTVDGVTNTAVGDVHSGEFGQQLPQLQKEKTAFKKSEFFNGKDLIGWSASEMKYWSVKDGAIVGHSAVNVPKNEFIWSDVEVKDFYLTVDVKLTPDDRNAGIQFRSKLVDASGQAIGYQADVGAGVWGKLYHEHGRGELDWNDNATGAVKPGEWNRYEILAVGHKIWTAINGKLCVAIEDPTGELSGKISFQIHGGAAQTVLYRNPTLVHNPKIALEKQTKKQLLAALPEKAEVPKPASPQPISTPLPHWTRLIVAVDLGSQGEAWAKPTFDHSKWKTMKVPGHFDTVELPGFDGVVWFRKTIELSAEQAKSKVILHLGQIDDMDVTWVNGVRVGGYEDPGDHYTVRNYPVPAGLLETGKNTIAVRVMDHGAPGGIAGTPEQLFLQLDDERISLANRWHFAPGANLAALNKYSQVPALVRPLTRPTSPVPAFADGFAIDSDQTIAVVGGTNALESGRHGYLETLLTAAHPQHQVRVRNLAWQADTVYQQQRPRNFYAPNKPDYGESDDRAKIEADIVFFWMGQTESLDGPDRVVEFTAAYEQHLDHIAQYTKRIVLVTPVPFSNPLGLDIDIQKRNKSLAVYVAAIRKIGRERKLPVVNLAKAFGWGATPFAHSQNGMHLLPVGHWEAARIFAGQLGFADRVASIKWAPQTDAALEPLSAEKLRQAIGRKNDLWFRYWRPTNWAFLYGNRQQTPSSRDHENPGRRWFPEELQKVLPHLDEAEQRIHQAAKAASR